MNRTHSSLVDLIEIRPFVDVVDIGANPIGGDAPYKPLLDMGLAHVYGFEPNPNALAKLNAVKGENETYIAAAVYDGRMQEIRICTAESMASLLEPNSDLLSYFHGFPEWGEVQGRFPIPTVRLDDVLEIQNMDYLKIDIQGAELEVFRNGTDRLSDCLVVHTEVEFLPMYEGQPLFSEVELFLRELGFMIHHFAPLERRIVQPMLIDQDTSKGANQMLWADAVFIKDFTKFDHLDSASLEKIALIMNDIYGSFDIVQRALMSLDKKNNSKLNETYLTNFS